MSTLTTCNYCNLQRIKRDNPEKEVILKQDRGMLRVYIDDEPQGWWFMAMSEHCVC